MSPDTVRTAAFIIGLRMLARGYAQGVGKMGGTPAWFADLGVPYTPPEPRGHYLGELG